VTIASLALRALLVGVLAWSAGSKLTPGGFRSAVTMFESMFGTGRHARLAAAALVVAEAATAVLLAAPWTARAGSAAAVGLFAALTAGTAAVVRRRLDVHCACFGRRSARVSGHHIARNTLLLIAAAATFWPAVHPVALANLVVALAAGGVLAVLVGHWDDLAFLFAEPNHH
jgi:hypothetical protein